MTSSGSHRPGTSRRDHGPCFALEGEAIHPDRPGRTGARPRQARLWADKEALSGVVHDGWDLPRQTQSGGASGVYSLGRFWGAPGVVSLHDENQAAPRPAAAARSVPCCWRSSQPNLVTSCSSRSTCKRTLAAPTACLLEIDGRVEDLAKARSSRRRLFGGRRRHRLGRAARPGHRARHRSRSASAALLRIRSLAAGPRGIDEQREVAL